MERRLRFDLRMNLHIDKAINDLHLTVAQRVKLAGQLLRDAVAVNLSRPVVKRRKTLGREIVDPATGLKKRVTRTVVDPHSRSKPGEFPRADTTRLMKSIFHRHDAQTLTSRVGTPLDYGVVLELRMDRSFLRRTLNELRGRIILLIQGGTH
jgi:hypothetical protein